jgi:hypothetical protein
VSTKLLISCKGNRRFISPVAISSIFGVDHSQATLDQMANNTVSTPRRPLSFLDLDYDVRLIIYRALLIRPKPIPIYHLEDHSRRKYPSLVREGQIHSNILQTCAQVYGEAIPILYGKNSFFFRYYLDVVIPNWSEFISIIGDRQASHVTQIQLRILPLQRTCWQGEQPTAYEEDFKTELPIGFCENLLCIAKACPNIRRLTFQYCAEDVTTPLLDWRPQIQDIFFTGSSKYIRDTKWETDSMERPFYNLSSYTHTISK